MIRRGRVPAFFLLLSVSFLMESARGEDWPQFRGENASGVSTETKSLPTEFSFEDKTTVAWSAKLGDGIGSAIVAAGRCFATGMTGDEQFTVFAYEAATGKPLWQRDFATGKLPRITPPNSHASSTPCTDGHRVYAYFSTLGLVALDAADGRELWRFALPKPAYLMDWGAAMSPVVHGGTVFFCQDDDLAPTLFAIDAETGKLRWQTPRPEMLAGYAVPVFCKAGGREDVVIAGSGKMKGYDPATGKEVWTSNSMPRTVMTSPVVRDDVIYVSVQSYGDETRTLKFALLEWLDTNQDGKLARAEVPKEFFARFDQSDKNHDGVIADDELDTAFQSPDNMVGGGTTIQAVRGGGTGDVTATHVLWNIKNKAPSNLCSPVVVGDQVFVVKKGGISSSFAATDGSTHWELARIRNIGDYYASPVAGDGKIYVVGENGFCVVLKAGPKLEILAKNDLGESCLATPSIAGGRLYFRTRNHLYCIEEK
jgi:outer membrane protein assembly factor BamB